MEVGSGGGDAGEFEGGDGRGAGGVGEECVAAGVGFDWAGWVREAVFVESEGGGGGVGGGGGYGEVFAAERGRGGWRGGQE